MDAGGPIQQWTKLLFILNTLQLDKHRFRALNLACLQRKGDRLIIKKQKKPVQIVLHWLQVDIGLQFAITPIAVLADYLPDFQHLIRLKQEWQTVFFCLLPLFRSGVSFRFSCGFGRLFFLRSLGLLFGRLQGFGALLGYFGFHFEALLGGLIRLGGQALHLALNLSGFLFQPIAVTFVGLFLGDRPFFDAPLKVTAEKNAFVGQDSSGGLRRLRPIFEPFQSLVVVDLDVGGVQIGIVSSDPFYESSISRRTRIGNNDVVVRPALAPVPLQSNTY